MSCRSSSATILNDEGGNAFHAPTNLRDLKSATASASKNPVYAYIVTTIKTESNILHQTGSAPNFSGGRITLCTCKHKDRATFRPSSDARDPWKGVWVAGLTSKREDPSRSLAYLMLVERSFSDQAMMWNVLPRTCRQAKCASKSVLGDLYEPKASAALDPYDPAHYFPPIRGHVHSTEKHPHSWHHDIMKWGRRSKSHRLLLGQTEQSYRWVEVSMILKLNVIGSSAHHKMFGSLDEFIENLQEYTR